MVSGGKEDQDPDEEKTGTGAGEQELDFIKCLQLLKSLGRTNISNRG